MRPELIASAVNTSHIYFKSSLCTSPRARPVGGPFKGPSPLASRENSAAELLLPTTQEIVTVSLLVSLPPSNVVLSGSYAPKWSFPLSHRSVALSIKIAVAQAATRE